MQKIIIIGNVCKDPEINNGVAKFSVAVNEKYKGKESTEFFNCVAFAKTADVVENYVTKGMKLCVEGKQSTNEYEGKRYTSLLVNGLEMLGGGKQASKQAEPQDADLDDINIPF